MMYSDKARIFAALHKKGNPLVLYNIWDAASAQAVCAAGARAVATSSWSLAAAQGYADGETIPLDFMLQIVARISATLEVPVSIDFEGGYAEKPDDLMQTVTRLITAGVIGLNFEDQKLCGAGLYASDIQARRIRAIRTAAERCERALFINARTDIFLQEPEPKNHADLIDAAILRADIYNAAGADCFFVPGLVEPNLIEEICARVALPVNIMMPHAKAPAAPMAALGVARVSYGPHPFGATMARLSALANSQQRS